MKSFVNSKLNSGDGECKMNAEKRGQKKAQETFATN